MVGVFDVIMARAGTKSEKAEKMEALDKITQFDTRWIKICRF